MSFGYKVLGQASPINTNNADLYTVPSGKEAIISSLVVTNVTSASASCRIFIRPNADAAATGNALVYDAAVAPNDFIAIGIGITLDAADVITVRSGTASSLTFHAFGTEVTL